MLQDLDLTIKKILDDTTIPPFWTGVDVNFRTPDKTFAPSVPTINCFLYGVHENRTLRDPVPIVELVGGTWIRRRPPLRVDCDYLVTSWSKKADALGVAEEHLLLAQAMSKLSRFPLLPTSYLQNTLVGQPFPVQMWTAQSDDNKSLGEFWSALGMPPRSSFQLMVTIAMDLEIKQTEGPPVVTKEVVLDDDLDPTTPGEPVYGIGGVVRDALTAAPIVEATVALNGGRTATTDEEGRFTFAGVGAGAHTLTATAAGFTPSGDVPVTVPAAVINAYDILLNP